MNKTAFVTGSRRGIGLAIAKTLSKNGYKVILSDIIEKAEANELLCSLKEIGIDADYIKCNIAVSEDRENAVQEIVKRYGRIDLLVNNAGIAPSVRKDILDTTEESFDRVLNVNLRGGFFMCQTFANIMIKLKEENKLSEYNPKIVNIGSMSAYTSSTSRGEYCISKAGVSMTTLLFADRLAEYGIPVFEVRPGIIATDMTAAVTAKYEKLIAEGITPIKRFGQPEDVANCVAAAASGLLDFATGQVLNADGGFHIRRL